MVLLIAEGPSYMFHAVGQHKFELRRAFAKAWREHVKQTGADPRYENAVTLNWIVGVEFNKIYRDYQEL